MYKAFNLYVNYSNRAIFGIVGIVEIWYTYSTSIVAFKKFRRRRIKEPAIEVFNHK